MAIIETNIVANGERSVLTRCDPKVGRVVLGRVCLVDISYLKPGNRTIINLDAVELRRLEH